MVSRNLVFWEVDTQADFMLPGGHLYVPGAVPARPLERVVAAGVEHQDRRAGAARLQALDDARCRISRVA